MAWRWTVGSGGSPAAGGENVCGPTSGGPTIGINLHTLQCIECCERESEGGWGVPWRRRCPGASPGVERLNVVCLKALTVWRCRYGCRDVVVVVDLIGGNFLDERLKRYERAPLLLLFIHEHTVSLMRVRACLRARHRESNSCVRVCVCVCVCVFPAPFPLGGELTKPLDRGRDFIATPQRQQIVC